MQILFEYSVNFFNSRRWRLTMQHLHRIDILTGQNIFESANMLTNFYINAFI